VICLLVKPFQLLNLFEDKIVYQILSRVLLSTLFTCSYYCLSEAISKFHGHSVSKWVTLLTVSQFHFIFYSSRTLPNTFALILVIAIFSTWIKRKWTQMIFFIAFTVLVIRFETILLFFWILSYEVFYTHQLKIFHVFKVGIPSGLLCLLFTILFDSYMWSKWIWPEGLY